jgi:hypothetical protein
MAVYAGEGERCFEADTMKQIAEEIKGKLSST